MHGIIFGQKDNFCAGIRKSLRRSHNRCHDCHQYTTFLPLKSS